MKTTVQITRRELRRRWVEAREWLRYSLGVIDWEQTFELTEERRIRIYCSNVSIGRVRAEMRGLAAQRTKGAAHE